MRRVEVEWLDSVGEGRWQPREVIELEATRDAMLHRSVGCLIVDTDDFVLLAGSRKEDESWFADTMQIPKTAVLAIHELRNR